jgi:uncharacterized cofD-like protein
MADELKGKKIVCLGGGIGTSQLLRGLKAYNPRLTIVTSMADDGGSSGRLRKAYNIMPPGDIVSCIAALMPDSEKELESLLLYRFPGNNNANKAIDGHKLGNLLMLAEIQRTGDFYKAIDVLKKIFSVNADLFPATDQRVHLWAITHDNRRVHSETTLDLALYSQPHGLKKVYISPAKPKVNPEIVEHIMNADVIISGPGDLYTNQLPVLIVPEIKEAILASTARKMFVCNIANKPFETKDFTLKEFIQAISDHMGSFPFDTIIANNNFSCPIPGRFNYSYVPVDEASKEERASWKVIEEDVVNEEFPLYHDTTKLASVVAENI